MPIRSEILSFFGHQVTRFLFIYWFIYWFIDLFIYLPAFLDTGLPRENVHERNSGLMRGAIQP